MKKIYTKLFVLMALAFILSPTSDVKANTCDSVVLDLVCSSGQVLQGIDSEGNKICVEQETDSYGGMYITYKHRRTFNTSCKLSNHITSNCSCPSSFSSRVAEIGNGYRVVQCY